MQTFALKGENKERVFKTIRTRFYPLLKSDPVDSLEELNKRFWHWLEEDYHRRVHASLDEKTPHMVIHSMPSLQRIIKVH